jgi:hypothetical protein
MYMIAIKLCNMRQLFICFLLNCLVHHTISHQIHSSTKKLLKHTSSSSSKLNPFRSRKKKHDVQITDTSNAECNKLNQEGIQVSAIESFQTQVTFYCSKKQSELQYKCCDGKPEFTASFPVSVKDIKDILPSFQESIDEWSAKFKHSAHSSSNEDQYERKRIIMNAIKSNDPHFFNDLREHCGSGDDGNACNYVRFDHVQAVPSKMAALDKTITCEQDVPIVTPFDMDEIKPFEVAHDFYSVFGLAGRKHKAAGGACLLFRKLAIKTFARHNLSIKAFFSSEGMFYLYDKTKEGIGFSTSIVKDLLTIFTNHDFSKFMENKERPILQRFWKSLLEPSKIGFTEEKLDAVINSIHRSLESVQLIADSKQVNAMAKGVKARKKEVFVRSVGKMALVIGSAVIIGFGWPVAAGAAGAAAGAAAAALPALQVIEKNIKIPIAFWKSALADDKKNSADSFGKAQNQLRWVRGMLKWSENWLEPRPFDVESEAHPTYMVKPTMMCSHFAHENNVPNCSPYLTMSENPEVEEGENGEKLIPWDSNLLKEERIKYKARVLTTIIQFITNDGGCSHEPLEPPKPFQLDNKDEATSGEGIDLDSLRQKIFGFYSVKPTNDNRMFEIQAWHSYCNTKIQYNSFFRRKKMKETNFWRDQCSLMTVQGAESQWNRKLFFLVLLLII